VQNVKTFNDFYKDWKDLVKVSSGVELTRDLYFATKRDALGFDILPDYIAQQGVRWSVTVAGEFELASALASKLDGMELAKFRMIFDRVKNVTFDFLHESCEDGLGERELSILSALSTLFFIELNHIMRVYIYFQRHNENAGSFFDVIGPGLDTLERYLIVKAAATATATTGWGRSAIKSAATRTVIRLATAASAIIATIKHG